MPVCGHSMGLAEGWNKLRYGYVLAVLPAVWLPLILRLFLEDYTGCEKFRLLFLRSSVHSIFHVPFVVRPREHCLLQYSEENVFYSKVLMSTKIFFCLKSVL